MPFYLHLSSVLPCLQQRHVHLNYTEARQPSIQQKPHSPKNSAEGGWMLNWGGSRRTERHGWSPPILACLPLPAHPGHQAFFPGPGRPLLSATAVPRDHCPAMRVVPRIHWRASLIRLGTLPRPMETLAYPPACPTLVLNSKEGDGQLVGNGGRIRRASNGLCFPDMRKKVCHVRDCSPIVSQ